MTEYTKLSKEETTYGRKSFLQMQLDLLTIIKRIKEYRSLRNDEFAMKIALKNKIEEALLAISNLEKSLPKMKVPNMPKKEEYEEIVYDEDKSSLLRESSSNLDQELERIKAKLARLK